MGEELRAGLYAFDLVQKRATRPAGAPDQSLARPVTKVGVVGAGLMASQLALLFARRLRGPGRAHRPRPGAGRQGRRLRARRDRQAARPRAGISPDEANRLRALVTGSLTKDGLRRRRLRHRGGVRGADGQEAGLRRGRDGRLGRVRAGDQHLVAVGDRDGRRTWRTRSGWSASTSSTRSRCCRCWRSSAAERTDDATLATAFAVGKTLKKSCVLVKDAPAFVVNRLLTRFLGEVTRGGRRGHAGRRGGRRARAARPADAPVRAAAAGRPGGRAARRARRCTTAFPDRFAVSARTCGRLVAAGKPGVLTLGPTGPAGRPGGRRAARGRRPAVRPRSRCASGRWRRWPRRSG